jgi:hypothetical protein
MKKPDIEISESDLINCNDDTTWEARKFNELLNEVEPLTEEQRKQKRIKHAEYLANEKQKDVLMQWCRLQIYHSKDIQKDNLGGGRLSIVNSPEYFANDIKDLKKILRDVTIWTPSRVKVSNDEICIRFGSTLKEFQEIFVDYYVQINKDPSETPTDLDFRMTWGLWA